jgi:hypothetical protein
MANETKVKMKHFPERLIQQKTLVNQKQKAVNGNRSKTLTKPSTTRWNQS